MPYIELADFKANNSITTNLYDTQIEHLLTMFSNKIDSFVGSSFFKLTEDTQKIIRGQSGGINYIKIGVWQTSPSLIVKKGVFGSDTLETLELNKDYYLYDCEQNEAVVYALQLPFQTLYALDFLEITGTFGWSAGLPDDLKMLLENATLKALNYRLSSQTDLQTNGKEVESERSGNLTITYKSDNSNKRLSTGDLLAVQEIADLLEFYKSFLKNNFTLT